jgi:hypothetical protein
MARKLVLGGLVVLAMVTVVILVTPAGRPVLGEAAVGAGLVPSRAAGELVVLGWNDLGMHCYNNDASNMLFLPPFNTLWAQVVRVGNPPQIVTTGITVTYYYQDNTYSVGKTNFWSYAQAAFGLAAPLPANISRVSWIRWAPTLLRAAYHSPSTPIATW